MTSGAMAGYGIKVRSRGDRVGATGLVGDLVCFATGEHPSIACPPPSSATVPAKPRRSPVFARHSTPWPNTVILPDVS